MFRRPGPPLLLAAACALLLALTGVLAKLVPITQQGDARTLNGLYRNKGSYISAINRRLMELVREGWMLPEYAEDVRADAQAIDITPPGKR